MQGEYKIVVGVPQLRVYDNDIVVSSNNKPLLFNGYDNSTTIYINGKIRRVKKKDIITCANNGTNLLLFLNKNKDTRNKVPIRQIRLYDDCCEWTTSCAVGVRNNDCSPILKYLYRKLNNYVSHLSYFDINIDELQDIITDACIDIANDIVSCKRTVFAPDNYIIKTAKNRIILKLKDIK